MSTVLLDVTRLLTRLYSGQKPTGVDRVGLAYIQHYGSHARAVLSRRGRLLILNERDSKTIFSEVSSARMDRWRLRSIVALAMLRALLARPVDGGVLLHTSHNGMEFLRYYATLAKYRVRVVFMVHDLIPITHPEYCRAGVGMTHRARIHTALRHASGLIANSDDTRAALAHEAAIANEQLPPCVVAHLAPGIEASPAAACPIEEPYFVMLGTIEPRKNHWFMLHIWRQLVERFGPRTPRLVIIGRRGWECENVIDMLERSTSLEGFVIEESNCNDTRLQAWLQHARALLFPSFVEGYGMPLVEALMLRIPVIASDLPVFHEIATEIPDYLDPLDGPKWLALIQAYAAHDSPERAAQIARLAGFQKPTWAKHFKNVDRFLDELAR